MKYKELRKKTLSISFILLLCLVLCLAGCGGNKDQSGAEPESGQQEQTATEEQVETEDETDTDDSDETGRSSFTEISFEDLEIPEYSGEASVEILDNEPKFPDVDDSMSFEEEFTELDEEGRCGTAFACLDQEHMPQGERGSIGMVRPSGWQLDKYEFIDNGGYLYNRSHLIGWQLTGQNEEERNLITGTRYMNTEGMLPYENRVAEYLRGTGNHVLYRVTPIFKEDDLLARGVVMEARSVEDDGAGISFCVFCYNVQPGVEIDYATGANKLGEDAEDFVAENIDQEESTTRAKTGEDATYILNTNTRKFHYPYCSSVQDMKDKNKEEFNGTREEAIERGFDPCARCNP